MIYHLEPQGRYRFAPLVKACYGVRLVQAWFANKKAALAYIPQAGQEVVGVARV
jgi:hypothetical protein